MKKNLPPRPNLDHLRRQAKALLAALESGDTEAASTILNHLPAARGMTVTQILATRYRLADALRRPQPVQNPARQRKLGLPNTKSTS